MNVFHKSIYLVTDRSLSLGRPLEYIVEESLKGGAALVQLREKDCSSLEFYQLAARVKQITQKYAVPLIINDRLDIALAVDAEGLHIGQSDLPYDIARKLLGPDKIIGLSVENFGQAKEANQIDVDYIGVSPVFDTATKTDTSTALGLEGLAKISSQSRHPVVAIGGINLSNAAEVSAAGADTLAVVSAITMAEDPRAATAQLVAKM